VLREAQHALAREQERAAFLLEASSVLTASLNIDRCREATVQMAARHLADAAVVVAPAGRGRRMPIFYSDSSGAVEQRSVNADPILVHLDFSGLTFLDSAALSGLLLIHRRTSQSGVQLHLDHRPRFLDRVLDVTGLFAHVVSLDSEAETADPSRLDHAT